MNDDNKSNFEKLKKMMEESGARPDGAFVALCHFMVGVTGSDAMVILSDSEDEPMKVGAVFKPGYERLPYIIASLEIITNQLKEREKELTDISKEIQSATGEEAEMLKEKLAEMSGYSNCPCPNCSNVTKH